MSLRSCDLCGSKERREIPEARRYGSGGVCCCLGCGFVYVPERRGTQEVAASWGKIFDDGGYTSSWPGVKARLTYVAEYFQQQRGWFGKSLVEIGAGQGSFLSIAKTYGTKYQRGIEPHEPNCAMIERAGHMAFNGTIEDYLQKLRLDRLYPDVVAILWTLENTADCIGMLKAARQLLDGQGTLIVATGSRIMVPFKKRLSKYFGHNPPDTHCFRFSARSLCRALEIAGFNHVEFNDYNERDELVALARTTKHPDFVYSAKDDPIDVISYFERWGAQWP
jgi:hypothetical protein